MSSTRHATDDSTLRQERWCSDPSFNDSINGMAAAKRISRVPDGRMRKLLWFIQLRSLQPNGIKDLAAELLQEFPDRIGTPASRRLDATRKAPLTEAEFKELVDEWGPTDLAFDDWSLDFLLIDRPGPDKYEKQYHYAYQFLAQLDEAVKGLPVRLVRMCVDPEMAMEDGHAKERKYGQEAVAGVWYFTDLLGALCLLQEQHGERAAANVARTAISIEIEDNLDFCLGEQSWILVEGVSGLGKSNTIKGWCARHSGEVRYVEIPSSNDDRSFYAAIAESLGVARGNSYNLQQIKLRVEDMLKASGLLLALAACRT